MTITFDAKKAHASVCRMPNYLANKEFAANIQWKRRGNASVLLECNKDSSEVVDAVCVIVAEVSSSKLFTGPLGNYNPEFNKLATAKYQLSLTCPADPVFRDDFKMAMKNLSSVEDLVAIGPDKRYLTIPTEGGSAEMKDLRLSALIAERRTRHLDASEELDDDTASIRVDDNMRETFDKFKLTHKMLPLKVYGPDDAPIAPEDVSRTIGGALAEVYFKVKHYYMGNGETKYNCFSGIMEQIIVLRGPEQETPSPFRAAGRKGPFRPKLMDIAPMAPLVVQAGGEDSAVETPTPSPKEKTVHEKVTVNGPSELNLGLQNSLDNFHTTFNTYGDHKNATTNRESTALEPAPVLTLVGDAEKDLAKVIDGDRHGDQLRETNAQDELHLTTLGKESTVGGARQLRSTKNKASDELGGDEKRRKEA